MESTVSSAEAIDIRGAVRELARDLEARAAEGDALRTLPADLAQRAKRSGLFRLNLPRALGGLELDLPATVRILEELSRADGSGGWSLMIGNSTAFFAWLEPAAAAEMIAGRVDFASTSTFAPEGRAVRRDPGTLTVSGRWAFNSGCRHAEWLQFGVLVMDGDRPRLRDDGAPDWRMAFVPRDRVEIEDTWQAGGLLGTGSHHVTLADVPVPDGHFAAPFFEPARHDGPLWRIPFFTLVAILMSGFPLGVARRALDEFTALARHKVRSGATQTVCDDGHAQVALARAEGAVQAARAFVFEVVGDIWDVVCRGEAPTWEQRLRALLAAHHAMAAGVEAVDAAYALAGGGAVFSGHPLQRCFRDIHAAQQHAMYGAVRAQMFAKARFGISQPTFRI